MLIHHFKKAIKDLQMRGKNKRTQDVFDMFHNRYHKHEPIDQNRLDDLLAQGINHTLQNHIGTPLYYALCVDTFKTVQKIIDAGADLNLPCHDYGFTPTIRSIINKKNDCLEYLIQKGADLNKQDKDGDTPLHHAMHWNNPEAVRILILANVDLTILNHKGQDYATIPAGVHGRVSPKVIKEALAEKHTRDHAHKIAKIQTDIENMGSTVIPLPIPKKARFRK